MIEGTLTSNSSQHGTKWPDLNTIRVTGSSQDGKLATITYTFLLGNEQILLVNLLEHFSGLIDQSLVAGVVPLDVAEDGIQIGHEHGRMFRVANPCAALHALDPIAFDRVAPDQLEVEGFVSNLQIGCTQQ